MSHLANNSVCRPSKNKLPQSSGIQTHDYVQYMKLKHCFTDASETPTLVVFIHVHGEQHIHVNGDLQLTPLPASLVPPSRVSPAPPSLGESGHVSSPPGSPGPHSTSAGGGGGRA